MGMGGLEVQMDDGPQLIDNDYDDSNLNNNFDDGDDANSELVDVNAEPAPIVEVRETHHNISANVKVKALEGKKSAKLAQGFVPKFAPIAAEDSDPRSSCANWSSIKDSINVDRNFNMAGGDLGSSSASTMKENHFEEDGRLQMYWIDAYESNGVVYLFGKVGFGR